MPTKPKKQSLWTSAAEAPGLAGVPARTLRRYRTACPILGRPIRTKSTGKKGGRGARVQYSTADLEAIGKATRRNAAKRARLSPEEWLTPQQAEEQFGFPRLTLLGWVRREQGCPVLGRRLGHWRDEHAGPTDPKLYLSVADLDRIKRSWSAQRKMPEVTIGGKTYLSSALAKKRGVSKDRLVAAKENHDILGRAIDCVERLVFEPAGGKGRFHTRWYWLEADVMALANRAAHKSAESDGWLTASEVAEEYGAGYSLMSLWKWADKGCPALGGRKLKSQMPMRLRKRSRKGKTPYLVDARSREYLAADLDTVRDVIAQAKAEAENPNSKHVGSREACEVLGVSSSCLWNWTQAGQSPEGLPLEPIPDQLVWLGNRLDKATMYARGQVKAVVDARKGCSPLVSDSVAVDGDTTVMTSAANDTTGGGPSGGGELAEMPEAAPLVRIAQADGDPPLRVSLDGDTSLPQWSKADTKGSLAKLLGLNRNTFAKRLDDGTYRFKEVGKLIQLDKRDLPDSVRKKL